MKVIDLITKLCEYDMESEVMLKAQYSGFNPIKQLWEKEEKLIQIDYGSDDIGYEEGCFEILRGQRIYDYTGVSNKVTAVILSID